MAAVILQANMAVFVLTVTFDMSASLTVDIDPQALWTKARVRHLDSVDIFDLCVIQKGLVHTRRIAHAVPTKGLVVGIRVDPQQLANLTRMLLTRHALQLISILALPHNEVFAGCTLRNIRVWLFKAISKQQLIHGRLLHIRIDCHFVGQDAVDAGFAENTRDFRCTLLFARSLNDSIHAARTVHATARHLGILSVQHAQHARLHGHTSTKILHLLVIELRLRFSTAFQTERAPQRHFVIEAQI
mmetsp:Transcript_13637/g.21434  ORF Transcript_13637/g.21434 Transcript_13637/m.21434 type:complete len:244 (+) Transcript_13637:283-1014(+)